MKSGWQGITTPCAAVKQPRVVRSTGLLGDLLSGRNRQFIGLALDEIAETITSVKAGFQGCSLLPVAPGLRFCVTGAADIDYDGFAGRTKVFEDVPDSLQVIHRNVITNIFIGGEQGSAVLACLDLQGTNPGIEIVGRKLTFQVVDAGFPVTLGHSKCQNVNPGLVRCKGSGLYHGPGVAKSNVLWIT